MCNVLDNIANTRKLQKCKAKIVANTLILFTDPVKITCLSFYHNVYLKHHLDVIFIFMFLSFAEHRDESGQQPPVTTH